METVVRHGVPWIELDRSTEPLARLLHLPMLQQRVTEAVVDRIVAGIQGQCPLECPHRLIETPRAHQDHSQIIVSWRRIGFRGDSATQRRFRLGQLIQLQQYDAQVAPERLVRGCEPDRASQCRQAVVTPARLKQAHAEKMRRLGIRRLAGENLPVHLLGLPDLSALEQPRRKTQQSGSRACATARPSRYSAAALVFPAAAAGTGFVATDCHMHVSRRAVPRSTARPL